MSKTKSNTKTVSKPAKAAVPVAAMGAVNIGGVSYARKPVTLPLHLIQDHETATVRVDSAFHLGKVQKDRKGANGEKMEPMTLANVTMLDTGEVKQLIVAAALKSTLEETYPDGGYVGRAFEITCNGKAPGKRYKTFTVIELQAE